MACASPLGCLQVLVQTAQQPMERFCGYNRKLLLVLSCTLEGKLTDVLLIHVYFGQLNAGEAPADCFLVQQQLTRRGEYERTVLTTDNKL